MKKLCVYTVIFCIFAVYFQVTSFASPVVVQSVTLDCTTGCTDPVITPTSSTTAGDSLVLLITSDEAPTSVKTNVGQWFMDGAQTEADATVFVHPHYLLNALSSTSVTIEQSNWHGYAVLYEISGANAVDIRASKPVSLSTTSSAALSAASTQTNEVIFGAIAGFPSTPTITGDLTADYTTAGAVFSHAIETSTGSYSYGGTWTSGSGRPTISMIGLYEAAQPTTYPPVMSPYASSYGTSYGTTQTVSVAEQIKGSTIYCTTDGSTPTTSSTVYTAPITISSSETVSCIAQAPGYNVSSDVVGSYVITGRSTPETFYVRSDGGTRYDSNATSGQCNGMYDAPYPGTGVDQNCAFGDWRYLYDDKGTYGKLIWAIQGGDTVIVRGGPWRVGWDNGSTGTWCSGLSAFTCYNPPLPSGTAEQPTRILGENYGSCTASNTVDKTKTTQIFGGYGVYMALNLQGSQHVDVECLEITSHAQCITHGVPELPSGCSTSTPISDFDSDGIDTNTATHDITLTDMWIHGHTNRGVKGAIGGVVTCTYCDIAYNGMAGWDFDDGTQNQPSGTGVPNSYGTASFDGTWNFDYSTIEWSGCNEIYPTSGANTCYGQSNGGYGDGVGSPPGGSINASLNHAQMLYNVQDGLDLGHEDAGPSGSGYSDQSSSSFSVVNSYGFGNSGAPYKWGPNNSPSIIEGNVLIGNCQRLAAAITGAASGFNANLGDYCRSGDGLSFNFHAGSTGTITNNTMVTYFATAYLGQCWEGDYYCPGTSLTFKDNITYGLQNPLPPLNQVYNGNSGGIGSFYWDSGSSSSAVISSFNRSNNEWYGTRSETCSTYANEVCADPLFLNEPAECLVSGGSGCTFTEATWDVFLSSGYSSSASYNLTSSSPARDSGVSIDGVVNDFSGNAYASPPSMGAVEFVPGVLQTITVTPNPGYVTTGSTSTFIASCQYSDGSTTPCSITWSDTDAHSSVGSTTGVVTGVSVGSDTITATMNSVNGTAIVNIIAPPSFIFTQGTLIQGSIN